MKRVGLIIGVIVSCLSFSSFAAVLNVPVQYSTIQAAIDASVTGDEVVVAPGTYIGIGNTDINFKGKAIVVRSANGPTTCVIDCQRARWGFHFRSHENAASIIDGFTIIHGYQGAIWCESSSPTIRNCIIKLGGTGIFCYMSSSPMISNCLIAENSAPNPHGMITCYSNCNPIIVNCTVTANSGDRASIVSYNSKPIITNCIFWGNKPSEITYTGLMPEVSFSDVQGGFGGTENINVDPCFVSIEHKENNQWISGDYHLRMGSRACVDKGINAPPGGLAPKDIEGNLRSQDGDYDGTSIADMGCYEFIPLTGPYILYAPQEFKFVALKSGSNPATQMLRVSNLGRPPLNWQISEECQWLDVFPTNGVSVTETNEITLQVDTTGLAPGNYTCTLTVSDSQASNSPIEIPVTLAVGGTIRNVRAEYPTIQSAIDASLDGDTVRVASGTYTGDGNRDLDFKGKVITVQSVEGPNTCIINCQGTSSSPHRGFNFHSGETNDSIVDGFTVLNGYSDGGAIYIGRSSPIITNCHLMNNIAEFCGGAIFIWESNARISHCIISSNKVSGLASSQTVYGGGISLRGSGRPLIDNCTVTNNMAGIIAAGLGGGICSEETAIIINCLIADNAATENGGGVFLYGNSLIKKSEIIANKSIQGSGGGIALFGNAMARNCVISGNISTFTFGGEGGGVYCADSTKIFNCDIVGNTGRLGGGIACRNTSAAKNCIIWDNLPTEISIDSKLPLISFSNVKHGWPGVGNINNIPLWEVPGYWQGETWIDGDYHLLRSSPCINSGDPNFVSEPNETDVEGNPRVLYGRVDIGAYEFVDNLPVANAGQDQIIYTCRDCKATITFDGSGSGDADGDTLTYKWTWAVGGQSYEASGVNPTIELPIGTHTIQLVVNDGVVDSLPDEVSITVVGPVELLAQLQNELAAMNADKGVLNGLAAKVDTAVKKLADKNVKNNVAAVNALQAFINAVNAQRGKKITHEQADSLVAAAQRIIGLVH